MECGTSIFGWEQFSSGWFCRTPKGTGVKLHLQTAKFLFTFPTESCEGPPQGPHGEWATKNQRKKSGKSKVGARERDETSRGGAPTRRAAHWGRSSCGSSRRPFDTAVHRSFLWGSDSSFICHGRQAARCDSARRSKRQSREGWSPASSFSTCDLAPPGGRGTPRRRQRLSYECLCGGGRDGPPLGYGQSKPPEEALALAPATGRLPSCGFSMARFSSADDGRPLQENWEGRGADGTWSPPLPRRGSSTPGAPVTPRPGVPPTERCPLLVASEPDLMGTGPGAGNRRPRPHSRWIEAVGRFPREIPSEPGGALGRRRPPSCCCTGGVRKRGLHYTTGPSTPTSCRCIVKYHVPVARALRPARIGRRPEVELMADALRELRTIAFAWDSCSSGGDDGGQGPEQYVKGLVSPLRSNAQADPKWSSQDPGRGARREGSFVGLALDGRGPGGRVAAPHRNAGVPSPPAFCRSGTGIPLAWPQRSVFHPLTPVEVQMLRGVVAELAEVARAAAERS